MARKAKRKTEDVVVASSNETAAEETVAEEVKDTSVKNLNNVNLFGEVFNLTDAYVEEIIKGAEDDYQLKNSSGTDQVVKTVVINKGDNQKIIAEVTLSEDYTISAVIRSIETSNTPSGSVSTIVKNPGTNAEEKIEIKDAKDVSIKTVSTLNTYTTYTTKYDRENGIKLNQVIKENINGDKEIEESETYEDGIVRYRGTSKSTAEYTSIESKRITNDAQTNISKVTYTNPADGVKMKEVVEITTTPKNIGSSDSYKGYDDSVETTIYNVNGSVEKSVVKSKIFNYTDESINIFVKKNANNNRVSCIEATITNPDIEAFVSTDYAYRGNITRRNVIIHKTYKSSFNLVFEGIWNYDPSTDTYTIDSYSASVDDSNGKNFFKYTNVDDLRTIHSCSDDGKKSYSVRYYHGKYDVQDATLDENNEVINLISATTTSGEPETYLKNKEKEKMDIIDRLIKLSEKYLVSDDIDDKISEARKKMTK